MGGPCSNILCISFLPLWYPWGPTFHDTAFSTVLVEMEPAILRFVSQPSWGIFSVLVVLNSIQRFNPVRIGARLACCFLAYVPALLLSWRVLILGKVRVRSDPSTGVILGSCKVGSSDVPRFPIALTTSSIESVASVFRKMQFDKSIGVHAWELGAI